MVPRAIGPKDPTTNSAAQAAPVGTRGQMNGTLDLTFRGQALTSQRLVGCDPGHCPHRLCNVGSAAEGGQTPNKRTGFLGLFLFESASKGWVELTGAFTIDRQAPVARTDEKEASSNDPPANP